MNVELTSSKITHINSPIKISLFFSSTSMFYKKVTVVYTVTQQELNYKSQTTVALCFFFV